MIGRAPKTDGMSRTTVVDTRVEYSPAHHCHCEAVSSLQKRWSLRFNLVFVVGEIFLLNTGIFSQRQIGFNNNKSQTAIGRKTNPY